LSVIEANTSFRNDKVLKAVAGHACILPISHVKESIFPQARDIVKNFVENNIIISHASPY